MYNKHKNVELSIEKTIERLEGTWGLAILCKDESNKLYATRHGSPIVVSVNDNMAIVTSEQSGFCNLVSNYMVLNNYDICVLENIDGKITMSSKESYNPTKMIARQHIQRLTGTFLPN